MALRTHPPEEKPDETRLRETGLLGSDRAAIGWGASRTPGALLMPEVPLLDETKRARKKTDRRRRLSSLMVTIEPCSKTPCRSRRARRRSRLHKCSTKRRRGAAACCTISGMPITAESPNRDDENDVSRLFAAHNEFSGSAEVVIQAGVVQGDVHVHSAKTVRPRQLPPATAAFTGRSPELALLTSTLASERRSNTVVVSTITGAAGVGKTALAVYWAQQNREIFRDGQLYVDLLGFDPISEPLPVAKAIRGFLDALGVEPRDIPLELDDQIGLYRSLVAGRKILVLLDNAHDSDQLVPLIPGSPTCSVVVTSRNVLTELLLNGATLLSLDVLSETDARNLLVHYIREGRAASEPENVTELLRYCGGLPLAICIVGARSVVRPNLSLSSLADELRHVSSRLDGLAIGGARGNLRTVFSWSYEALDADARKTFRLLGLTTSSDISRSAVAAITGLGSSEIQRSLDDLVEANLLDEHRPMRYRMHDLLRLYAAELSREEDDEAVRVAATRRLLDFFLHSAYAGDRLLKPSRWPIELSPPEPGSHPISFAGEAAALTWFDDEHESIVAALKSAFEDDRYLLAWQLAWTLNSYQHRRGHIRENIAVWLTGLLAAERLGDLILETTAHRRLGYAYFRVAEPEAAEQHLYRGVEAAERSGEIPGLAHTHHALVWILAGQGELDRSLVHAEQALRFYEQVPTPVWEADLLNAVGSVHARLGNFERARQDCERSLSLFRELGHREGEATVLDQLGTIAAQTGLPAFALDHYVQATELLRSYGSSYMEAEVLTRLGSTYGILGRYGEARKALGRAEMLFRQQRVQRAAEAVAQQLAELPPENTSE